MTNKIINVIKEYPGLILLTGPTIRKDRDSINESGVVVKKGNMYYDCDFEYNGKRFPCTFIPTDDIRKELLICLERNGIKI